MSLVTRCPWCRTLFRVTPVQLQKRSGKVRCGRCMQTFNGFETLAVEQAGSAVTTAQPQQHAAQAAEATVVAETSALSAPSATRKPATAKQPTPTSQGRRSAAASAVSSLPPAQPIEEESRPPESARSRPWAAGSVLLVMLLAVQAAYVYRSELAARIPEIRPALAELCDMAGCAVTLPQRPDLVKIEASDVHVIDVSRPGLIQLTATLRSYANYDLAYPALDLVLTNANEHALARRIFVPDEYLDPTRDPKRGISPNAEITVALDLDTTDLNAAGFRLDLLAAPP